MTPRSASRRKKPAGFGDRWLDAVLVWVRADRSLTQPRRQVVVLIARIRLEHSWDGSDSYPSQATLARLALTTRDTVRQVDDWMVGHGLMDPIKYTGWGTSKHYRLLIPDDRPSRHQENVTDDRPVDRPVDRPSRHEPPTTNREEEEESAFAPSTYVPVAALQSADPEPAGDPAVAAQAIAAEIAKRAGMGTIDAELLAPALRTAVTRTGWDDSLLAIYCVELLQRNRGKVRHPSKFLIADLAHVNGHMVASPRMQLMAAISELADLSDEWPGNEGQTDPSAQAEKQLVEAGLVPCSEGLHNVWQFQPLQLQKALDIMRDVIRAARRRIEERPKPVDLFGDQP